MEREREKKLISKIKSEHVSNVQNVNYHTRVSNWNK